MSAVGVQPFSQFGDIAGTSLSHERSLLSDLDSQGKSRNLTRHSFPLRRFASPKESVLNLLKVAKHSRSSSEDADITVSSLNATLRQAVDAAAAAAADDLAPITTAASPAQAVADLKWKAEGIELIHDKLYFSTTDLSHLRSTAKTNHSASLHHTLSRCSTAFCSADESVLFIGLSAKELIDQSWINTDYFGPLSLTMLFKWRDLFLALNFDESPSVCFFIDCHNNPLSHVIFRENLRDEILVNAVLLLSICMMLFVYPKDGDDAVLSSIVDAQKFLAQMKQELCTFHAIDKTDQVVTVSDCIMGLTKAIQNNLLRIDTFDFKKSKKLKKVYDISWIVDGKIAASCSPNCKSYFKSGVCPTLDEYVECYKEKNIMGVIRLNDPLYDRNHFVDQGIEHLDIPFMDGGVPSGDTVRTFLAFVDKINKKGGSVIVHCRGGIGRTGTLISCFLMKEYRFTANEAVAYLRLARPGSVSSLQHYYLKSVEGDLQKMACQKDAQEGPVLPLPNPEVIRRSCIHTTVKTLGIDVELHMDAHTDKISLTFAQMMNIFSETRGNIMGGNKSAVHQIPYLHPRNLPLEGDERCIHMTVGKFLCLVENIMTCGRLDVNESLSEIFKGKQLYH